MTDLPIPQEMIDKVTAREQELIKLPEVEQELMKIKKDEGLAKAKEWLGYQALITLLYSHEERMEMQAKARAKEDLQKV